MIFNPALLVLEDGRSFLGQSFGAEGETFGDVVISTGLTDYQETLTNPSNAHKVVIATVPHTGNTGWESTAPIRIVVAGYVVRDPSPRPSSFRPLPSLGEYMNAQNIVGISDIDTRALTRHLRDHGPMKLGISTLDLDPISMAAKVRAFSTMNGDNNA